MTSQLSMVGPVRRRRYRMSSLRGVLAALALLATMSLDALSVRAADLAIGELERAPMYDERCLRTTITFSGEVVSGDLNKLSQLVERAKTEAEQRKSLCFLNEGAPGLLMVMELDSQGGSYAEAWEIAKFLRKREISTFVRDGKNCLSACALIFLGGSVTGADAATLPSRALMPKATLGFQAPYPKLEDRQYDKAEVLAALQAAFAVSSDFIKESSKLDVPRGMLSDLLEPSQDNLFRIDTARKLTLLNISLNSSGIFDFSVDRDPPLKSLSFAQMRNWCRNSYEPDPQLTDADLTRVFRNTKALYVTERAVSDYFGQPARTLEIFAIPIADAAEGNLQYCIVAAVTRREPNDPSKGLGVSCIGYVTYSNDDALKAALKKKGFDGLRDEAGDRRCSTDAHASVPPDTALPEIPAAIEAVKRNRPIFSSK